MMGLYERMMMMEIDEDEDDTWDSVGPGYIGTQPKSGSNLKCTTPVKLKCTTQVKCTTNNLVMGIPQGCTPNAGPAHTKSEPPKENENVFENLIVELSGLKLD